MSSPLNVSYRRWRLQIFSVTWLAYAAFYLTRKAFSAAKNELKQPEVMGLTKAQMSAMDGAYSAGYALGQFLWGTLGDRFGARRVVLIGMMASIVTSVLMGLSNTALLIGVFFTAQGIWQASGWAPLNKNMGEFFSQKERGTIMGFWCTNYAIGGFIATIIASYVAKHYGWRNAFVLPGLLLLGVWILFYFFQRNRPEDVGLPSIEEYQGNPGLATSALAAGTPATASGSSAPLTNSSSDSTSETHSTWNVILDVLRNRMVWILALSYFLIKPTRYLLLFWSPVYISERLGTNTADSGFLSSLFDLAGPIGTLLGGFLSDRVFGSKRMPVAVLALGLLAVLMIAFPFMPVSHWMMGAGMFTMGFLVFIPDSLISSAAAIDFGTKRGSSTANGLINGCGSIGQMLGVTLPGVAEQMVGKGQDIWLSIFVGLGISLALAALLLAPQWHRLPPKPQP